ncbi:MAG: hypothetical protein QOJ68_991 [Blastococcus sp.]|jgi:DNA-binding NarL/FixJ family response regulator|nr:hypothetical protein [Blastococcus sp.]
MAPLRVLVADDHPLFRDGLRTVLAATDDLILVAEAGNGEEAVRLAVTEQVDVALFDVHMPGVSGIEAAARVAVQAPGVRVLMLTMFQDDASIFAALRAGARGYVLKDADRTDLLRAVRAVGSGEAIFSPTIAARVLDHFGTGTPAVQAEEFPMLTTRERDVLHLIARGRSNPEIATRLGLTRKTTSNYVSSILGKLQVHNRMEAAERARRARPAG